MIYNILAIGDVVGESGLDHLVRKLGALKREKKIHFTVVNGENAANVGVLPQQVEQMLRAGADVVTPAITALASPSFSVCWTMSLPCCALRIFPPARPVTVWASSTAAVQGCGS